MNKKIITKLFLYSLMTLSILMPSFSYSEIIAKEWTKSCAKDNKENCIIGVLTQFENKEKKKQTLATIYIQKNSSSKKVMNLINEEDQTYKMGEEKKTLLNLIAHLPLNSDLTKKPILSVDNKNIVNLIYLNCNSTIGCRAMVTLDEEKLQQFKKGEVLSIIMPTGHKQPMKMDFPLKGFAKAFKKFTK